MLLMGLFSLDIGLALYTCTCAYTLASASVNLHPYLRAKPTPGSSSMRHRTIMQHRSIMRFRSLLYR